MSELERRFTVVPPLRSAPAGRKAETPVLPIQTDGSYTVEHDAMVYDQNTKLRIGTDLAVSSPHGVMVSDLKQKMVVGDLTFESPDGTFHSEGAMLDVSTKRIIARCMTMVVKKEPNQLLRPTEQAKSGGGELGGER